jgi:hypothetical protein
MEKKKRGRPPKVKVEEKAVVVSPPAPPVQRIDSATLSKLVLKGDLSGLSPEQKMEYYYRLCEHLKLDPVTRPFDIINIRGREIMYAHKGCTDQLRKQNGVSVTDVRGENVGDCYRVTAIGSDASGRTDAATGVVSIGKLFGDDLANALMKAETKAKRRLTLSLCGLGMLDESEIETIPGAMTVSLDSPYGVREVVPSAAPATTPEPTTITGKPAASLGNRLTALIANTYLTEEDRVKIRGEYRATCTTDKRRGEYLDKWEATIVERKAADMSGAEKAFFEDQNKPLPGEKVYEVGAE